MVPHEQNVIALEQRKNENDSHNPEVVGSNPAPATKNLQLVGLAGELFSYPGIVSSVQFSASQSKISICNTKTRFGRLGVTDRDIPAVWAAFV